jgi:hypothetical protein
MQYRVELVQTVVEVCIVFVQATNAQQAEDLALAQVTTGSGADWRFKDTRRHRGSQCSTNGDKLT